jgi:hypothetical protein
MEDCITGSTGNYHKSSKNRYNTEVRVSTNFEEDVNYLMAYYKKSLQKGNLKNGKLKKEIDMKREKLKNLKGNKNNESISLPILKETPKNKKEGVLRKDLFIKQLLNKKIDKQLDHSSKRPNENLRNNKSLFHPTNVFFELNEPIESEKYKSNLIKNGINNHLKAKSYSFYTYYHNLNIANKHEIEKLFNFNRIYPGVSTEDADACTGSQQILNNLFDQEKPSNHDLNLDLVYNYTNQIKNDKLSFPKKIIRLNNDSKSNSPIKLNNKFESKQRLSSPNKHETSLSGSKDKIIKIPNSDFEGVENKFLHNFNDPLNRKDFQISLNNSLNQENKISKNKNIQNNGKIKNTRNLNIQKIPLTSLPNTHTSNKTNQTKNTYLSQFLQNSQKTQNESNNLTEKTDVDEFNELKKMNIKSIDDNYKNLLHTKSKNKNCISICIGTSDDKEIYDNQNPVIHATPNSNHLSSNSRIFTSPIKNSSLSVLSNPIIHNGNFVNLQSNMGKFIKPAENLKLKVNNLQLNADYLNLDGFSTKEKGTKNFTQTSGIKNIHLFSPSNLKPIVHKPQDDSIKEKILYFDELNRFNTCNTSKSYAPDPLSVRSSSSNKNIFKSKNNKFIANNIIKNNTKLRSIKTAASRKERTESSFHDFFNSREIIKVDDFDDFNLNATPINEQISARDLNGPQISPIKQSNKGSDNSIYCLKEVINSDKNPKKIIFSKLNINVLK